MAAALARSEASLEDRWTAPEGWFYMTGMQALVRLPIQQRLRDAAAGLNTGGYISGYRGSPMGRFDIELWRAEADPQAPTTSSSAPASTRTSPRPRSGARSRSRAFPARRSRACSASGTARGRASTARATRCATPISPAPRRRAARSRSPATITARSPRPRSISPTPSFVAVGMPVLYPSNTQELIDFGLHGIAMSRFSGCWVGMKIVTDVAEGGGTVYVGPDSPADRHSRAAERPAGRLRRADARHAARAGGAALRPQASGRPRLRPRQRPQPHRRRPRPARGSASSPPARPGRTCCRRSAISASATRRAPACGSSRSAWCGRSIPSSCASSPTASTSSWSSRRSARSLEDQIRADPLRDRERAADRRQVLRRRPRSIPRHGAPAMPNFGETSPELVAETLVKALRARTIPACALDAPAAPGPDAQPTGPAPVRSPGFCAGCPHNRSTRVPEGSRALAGIGCHTMAMLVNPMQTTTVSHMGGEGAMWLGQQPFTTAEPRLRQSRRRHLRPFGPARDPAGGRGRACRSPTRSSTTASSR